MFITRIEFNELKNRVVGYRNINYNLQLENETLNESIEPIKRDLKKNDDIEPYLQEVEKDRDSLQTEVDRLRLLLQERQELEFGLGRDEIKTLWNNIYQLRTKYIKVMGEYAELEDINQELKLELRISQFKVREVETDKKCLIELELSSEVMKLLDEMAHELPEAFVTRDKGYEACIEKLVLILRNKKGE